MAVASQRYLNSSDIRLIITKVFTDVIAMSDSGRDSDADMKTSSLQRTQKRVSKPVMEKRRRERINNSLEALRLLMVEGTDNEKLKNPKVEKAEILESVVQFLKRERQMERGQQAMRRSMSGEPMPNCAQQQSYHNGMRACMLRVNHFMRQGAKENAGTHGNPVPFPYPGPQVPLSPREFIGGTRNGVGAALAPQHLPHHQLPGIYRLHYSPGEMLPSPVVPVHINETMWRPWPK